MSKRAIAECILAVLFVLLVFAIVCLLITVPVLYLWNWVMPIVFGLPVITFWQTLGLLILSGVFFKNPNFNKSKGE